MCYYHPLFDIYSYVVVTFFLIESDWSHVHWLFIFMQDKSFLVLIQVQECMLNYVSYLSYLLQEMVDILVFCFSYSFLTKGCLFFRKQIKEIFLIVNTLLG
jgi:hypothetical protein